MIRRGNTDEYSSRILAEYDAKKCALLFAELVRNGTWMTSCALIGVPPDLAFPNDMIDLHFCDDLIPCQPDSIKQR